jgi:hypothetical protein
MEIDIQPKMEVYNTSCVDLKTRWPSTASFGGSVEKLRQAGRPKSLSTT